MVMRAFPENDQNSCQSKSSKMKELSHKAAGTIAQISTQNVQESLIVNVRIDEEGFQARITKLLPLKGINLVLSLWR